MLRLPPGLREAVAKLADANGRSINAELIAAIENHLSRVDRLTALEQQLNEIRNEMRDRDERLRVEMRRFSAT